jgi:hypothetical protein
MYDDNKTEKFWTFISRRMNAEAALADWRLKLGDNLDFDKLHRRYLAPTGKMAEVITCPDQCDPSCGFRKVCEWEGKYEAVCRERMRKDYAIEKVDALFFTIKPSGLLPEIVKILKIIPHIEDFGKEEDTWKLGVVPLPGGKSATVYITLKIWSYTVMDLIFQLNCAERQPYILLVTDRKVINETCGRILKEMGSAFVPLNEVLDFNAQTELELIRECHLSQLVTPSTPEPELEPENIFRKCGDAWEIRFDGGEKFVLTSADTGARYLHFMLSRPGISTPITEIIRKVSGESENVILSDRFEGSFLTDGDGYSFSELPDSIADNIADDKAIQQYKKEINQIKYDIEKAKSVGDNITVEQLEQDLHNLTVEINEIISPAGQGKKFSDNIKKQVDSFRYVVNHTIDRIALHDQTLAKYLNVMIKFGRTPGYKPVSDISWIL